METIEKKKPSTTPKVEMNDYLELKDKVDALERVLAKMAHQSGIPNSVFTENNLQHYVLEQKDLKKYS